MADKRVTIVLGAQWRGDKAFRDAMSAINGLDKMSGQQANAYAEQWRKVVRLQAEASKIQGKMAQNNNGIWAMNGDLWVDKLRGVQEELGNARSKMKELATEAGVLEERTTKSGRSFKDMAVSMASAMYVAQQVIDVIKRVGQALLDITTQGAAVTQIADSFRYVEQNILRTTGTLKAMSSAAQGTISDTQLMANLFTLLAGSSENLQRQFAGAAPALLEISKAASKLNPTLGDTEFMFQSISRGIKRLEFRLLDNLGLNIKIGAANEAMAESLGKTVEELSSEEKVMGLLNETLRVGDILISQVGGSVEAAQDPVERLNTEWKNWTDQVKAGMSEALMPFVAFMAGDYQSAMYEAIMATRALGDEAVITSNDIYMLTQAAAAFNEQWRQEHGMGAFFNVYRGQYRDQSEEIMSQIAQAVYRTGGAEDEFRRRLEEAGFTQSQIVKSMMRAQGLDLGDLPAASTFEQQWEMFAEAMFRAMAKAPSGPSIWESPEMEKWWAVPTRNVVKGLEEAEDEFSYASERTLLLFKNAGTRIARETASAMDDLEATQGKLEDRLKSINDLIEDYREQIIDAQEAIRESIALGGDAFTAALESDILPKIQGHGETGFIPPSTEEDARNATRATLELAQAETRLARAQQELADADADADMASLTLAVMDAEDALASAAEEAENLNSKLRDEGSFYVKDYSEDIRNYLVEAFYDAADAAGAGAIGLATIEGAMGDMSAEALDAALRLATVNELMGALGEAYTNAILGGMDASDAAGFAERYLQQYQDFLEGRSDTVDVETPMIETPQWDLPGNMELDFQVPDMVADPNWVEFQQEMNEAYDLDIGVVLNDTPITAAKAEIEELQGAIEILGDLRTAINVQIDLTVDSINEIGRQVAAAVMANLSSAGDFPDTRNGMYTPPAPYSEGYQ